LNNKAITIISPVGITQPRTSARTDNTVTTVWSAPKDVKKLRIEDDDKRQIPTGIKIAIEKIMIRMAEKQL
jgi:hypothetical protein